MMNTVLKPQHQKPSILPLAMANFMKKMAYLTLLGVIAGAISWASAGLVSSKLEPFDSDVGFYVSQFILSIGAIYIGYRNGILSLLLYLLAAYIGMNLYAYIMGGLEQRAWASLGMVTTAVLLVYPLLSGLAGKSAKLIKMKFHKAI